MKYAFVFPGQGSQFVGMGKELAENFKTAKEVFQEVNDALSQDLFKLMVEGPENELTLTGQCPACSDGQFYGDCARSGKRFRR